MPLALLAAIIALGAPQIAEEPLHAAFQITQASIDKIWEKGAKDGAAKRDLSREINLKAQRQIDSYHVSIARKEGCSWAWLLHPRTLIYAMAHKATAQYWSDSEKQKAKADMDQFSTNEMQVLGFYVLLNEMPSFNAAYGRLSRLANPDYLKDIRCVLKVGDRVIQPLEQPGDLTLAKSDQVGFFSYPVNTYVRGTSSSTASISGAGGYANISERSKSSYVVTSTAFGQESYSTYTGSCIVLFPLRDAEGKPNIGPKDKEITLLVIKSSAELTANYKLDDWMKAFE